jgi:hypothetical protein
VKSEILVKATADLQKSIEKDMSAPEADVREFLNETAENGNDGGIRASDESDTPEDKE